MLLLLGSGSLFGAAVVGGGYWLNTEAGNDWIRRQILYATQPFLPEGRLDIERLRIHLRGVLEVDGISLVRWDEQPLLTIDRVRVELQPRALFGDTIELGQVLIEQPHVRAERLADGTLDWNRAMGVSAEEQPTTEPAQPWEGLSSRLHWADVRLVNGAVSMIDGEATTAVRDISLSTAISVGGGRWASVERLKLRVRPDGLDSLRATGGVSYEQGTLVVDNLHLLFGDSRATIDGTIGQVETDPLLGLSVEVDPLAAHVAAPWTEMSLPAEPLNLSARVFGPLSALSVEADLQTQSGQQARLHAQADVLAETLSWTVGLDSEGVDLHPLIPTLTESVHLAGSYSVQGKGTTWPDDIEAHIEARCPPQVIWGQSIEALNVVADLSDGQLSFEEAHIEHAIGNLDVQQGTVDLLGEQADVVLHARLPTLRALSAFGVTGVDGLAVLQGPISVDYGADTLQLSAEVVVQGQSLAMEGTRIDGLRTDALRLDVDGDNIAWSGSASLVGLESSGVFIDDLEVRDMNGSLLPSGAVDLSSTVHMGRLQVGDGTVVLEGLQGSVIGGVSESGLPILDTALQVGALTVVPIDFRLDGGPVELELRDNQLYADLLLSRKERVVVDTRARGNLDSGEWRIEELMLFPSEQRGVVVPSGEPVTFQMSEDGLSAGSLVLVLADADPTVTDVRNGDRTVQPYVSLRGGMGDGVPAVEFTAHQVALGWVADVVNLFILDAPPVAMSGTVDAVVRIEGEGSDAALSGQVSLSNGSMPDVARRISGTAALGGQLNQPAVDVTLHDRSGTLFVAQADVPVDLTSGVFRCDDQIRAKALLAPSTMERIAQRLPAVGELPEGRASMEMHVSGMVCDPTVSVVGAVETVVGARGEHGRVDIRVDRDAGQVTLEAGLQEGEMRRVTMDGVGADHLSDVLKWAVEGGPTPDLADEETWLSSLSVSLQPREMPLAMIPQLLGYSTRVSGNLDGELRLHGRIADPIMEADLFLSAPPDTETSRSPVGRLGDVNLYALSLQISPDNVGEQTRQGYLLDVRSELATSTLESDEGGKRLDFHGRMPWTLAMLRDEEMETLYQTPGWQLGFVGDGWLPLSALNGVIPGVQDAAGEVYLCGELAGSMADLRPTTPILMSLEGGSLTYEPQELVLEEMALDIRMTDDALVVEPSSLTSRPQFVLLGTRAPGRLDVEGTVALEHLVPQNIDLTVEMNDFWLSGNEEMRLAMSTDPSRPLRIGNEYPALAIHGGLILTEGSLLFDESFWVEGGGLALDERIHVVRREGVDAVRRAPVEPDEPSPMMTMMDVWLAVDLNNHLRVDVEMPLSQDYGQQLAALSSLYASTELTGQLDVRFQKNALSLVGDVGFNRGNVTWLGRDFSLDGDSELRFTGREYTNPHLDIRARYVTASYGDVVMGVDGPALEPSVQFTSENAEQKYDQTDLFAILLTGKPASAMADTEGESSSALMSAALAQVSGTVGSALSGTLVDEVDWDPSSGVRVGKALSDRLFLTYDWNNNADDNENKNQISLEWLVSRQAFAEFVTGDAAQSSAELYWRVLFGEAAVAMDEPLEEELDTDDPAASADP